MQDGGAGWFGKRAATLEKQVAEAEKEAGGNKDELELTLRRVRPVLVLLPAVVHAYA